MYHTVHRRLSTARTRDNKEMAQNGAKWHLQNKEKARRRMDMRFPVLTCATQPGEALNVTITSQMHQNASKCIRYPRFHRFDGPPTSPKRTRTVRHAPENNPRPISPAATIMIGGADDNPHEILRTNQRSICHWYENKPRQTHCRGNPCGCPSSVQANFHPSVCRLQGCMGFL